MSTVHIRICHDNDFIITQLADIEIVAISFRKTTSKSIDHGFDFGIGQYLINGSFFYI